MTPRFAEFLVATVLILTVAPGESASTKLRLRAVLHDPLRAQVDLFVPDQGGALVPLNLAVEGMSEPQLVGVTDGVLRLFDSEMIDPEQPLARLAARVAIPAGLKRAIVFIFPAGPDAKPAFRLLLLNDDPGAFRKAETRVINLTRMLLAMKAGEHALKLPAGKVTALPKVTRLNDLNQAHTSFYQQGEGENEWVLIAERPMQFTEGARNIILIYQMPNRKVPRLRTIIDTELR